MEICPLKSKVKAFKGQLPIRSETVRDNTWILGQYVHTFGIKISYKDETNITSFFFF